MPKLDKQNRLTIPVDLRKILNWKLPQVIAVCYDFSSKAITICRKEESNNKCILCFRKLDSNGRFFFPKEALSLLNSSLNESLIVYLKNNQIYISKL